LRIAIVSDTHSRYARVQRVLELIAARSCALILHCGDIEDAATVQLFQGLPAHFVFGNCDQHRAELRQSMQSAGVTLHEPFGNLDAGDKKIAWIHGDDHQLFREVEHSGHFDFLFHGHTHQREEHRTGPTRVVNPGALHRASVKTFAILDTATAVLESVVVNDS
jgi:putative phosphoesterase